eukprot:6334038-Pyramimonas_sp.AAC.1
MDYEKEIGALKGMLVEGCQADEAKDVFVRKLTAVLEGTSEASDEDSCEAALLFIAAMGTEHGDCGLELLDIIVPDILHVFLPCASLTV